MVFMLIAGLSLNCTMLIYHIPKCFKVLKYSIELCGLYIYRSKLNSQLPIACFPCLYCKNLNRTMQMNFKQACFCLCMSTIRSL